MYFGLSEDQIFFQDNIKKFLEENSSVDILRKIAANDRALAKEIHDGITNLGINGLLVPEEFGGLGLDILFAAAISESLGYGAGATPFIGSYVMAPIAIIEGGTYEQKQNYLAKIVSNEVKFGIGFTALTGARDNSEIQIEGNKISGRSLFVLDYDYATHFLISDINGCIGIIDSQSNGVDLIELKTIDRTRNVCELILKNVDFEILEETKNSKNIAEKVIDAGRVMLAADSLGAAQNMINKAVDYAKERKQFGRAIGSFQAVKHMCAEMAAELEPCYALVWHAAHAQTHMPDEARLMACQAKSHLSEVTKEVAKKATEVHGGMGFTDLLGLHYWFKRIGFNRQLLGSPESVREEAALLLLN